MDEVTSRNLIEVLNWLSYIKEKNDIINELRNPTGQNY